MIIGTAATMATNINKSTTTSKIGNNDEQTETEAAVKRTVEQSRNVWPLVHAKVILPAAAMAVRTRAEEEEKRETTAAITMQQQRR